jgi:hypothetical protein
MEGISVDCRSVLRLNVISRRSVVRDAGVMTRPDDFFRRLKANDVKIVAGNSVVRDMVVKPTTAH